MSEQPDDRHEVRIGGEQVGSVHAFAGNVLTVLGAEQPTESGSVHSVDWQDPVTGRSYRLVQTRQGRNDVMREPIAVCVRQPDQSMVELVLNRVGGAAETSADQVAAEAELDTALLALARDRVFDACHARMEQADPNDTGKGLHLERELGGYALILRSWPTTPGEAPGFITASLRKRLGDNHATVALYLNQPGSDQPAIEASNAEPHTYRAFELPADSSPDQLLRPLYRLLAGNSGLIDLLLDDTLDADHVPQQRIDQINGICGNLLEDPAQAYEPFHHIAETHDIWAAVYTSSEDGTRLVIGICVDASTVTVEVVAVPQKPGMLPQIHHEAVVAPDMNAATTRLSERERYISGDQAANVAVNCIGIFCNAVTEERAKPLPPELARLFTVDRLRTVYAPDASDVDLDKDHE